MRSKLQQSLSSLRIMISQVRAAIDWLSRPVRMDDIVMTQCAVIRLLTHVAKLPCWLRGANVR